MARDSVRRASCRQSMDVHRAEAEGEGIAAVRVAPSQPWGRGRPVAALIAQNLLVVLCLCISFHSWITVQSLDLRREYKESGIYLRWIRDGKFNIFWKQNIELWQNTITFPCSGPYMVYLSFSMGRNSKDDNNTLRLLHKGADIMTFHIKPSDSCDSSCQNKEYRVHVFSKNDTISLNFTDPRPKLNLKSLHVNIYYMLGQQCFE
ncbi:uncharacterized protein LOC125709379 [Brienomyrus brachyistius]|uniref:uncharacterized protein LOC125709379 n=1 Tax=Brienomyrus brachyistius TaxID=42636 RepID=UPI0020B3B717|nr:uncharacterized protein LOC125709379 [Brienomyrus brachyistius]